MKKSRITRGILMAGIGMAWITPESFAEKVIISTLDRGDGTSGWGADTWVSETSAEALKGKYGVGKMSGVMLVRCSGGKQDIAFIRFDLSELKGRKVTSAVLKLYAKAANSSQMTVLGLIDGFAGTDKNNNGTVNDDCDQHDEFWPEALLDRESAPGMLDSDGDPATVDWDKNAVVELGIFKNPGTAGEVSFFSDALLELINNDSNGVVTIMIQGSGARTSSYATKECPEGMPAPTLELETVDSNLIG